MQKQFGSGIAKISALFVSAFVVLDGLSMLGFGVIYFYITGVGDPGPGANKEISIYYAKIIFWLTCAYLVICLISLICWLVRRGSWQFVIFGLGMLPFIGSSYFLIRSRDLSSDYNYARFPFYSSLAINLCLFAFLVLDSLKAKSIRSKNDV
jgi:hypothetical protein